MELYIEKTNVEDEFVTLEIRVANSELDALRRGAYLVVAQRDGLDVAGGLAPRELVEGEFGESKATEMMLKAMKNFIAPFALSAGGGDYSVVGAPTFDDGERRNKEGDLIFEATWSKLPPLGLTSYDPVEITVPKTTVTDEEVDARVQEVADSYRTIMVDKNSSVVEDGSIVQISMECMKDGERFDQLCFTKRPYHAGSGQMPEGFDEALIGAKVGQTVHVDFLLPIREDIDGSMTGPSITADVRIEAMMREVTRVLTDEFIRENIPDLDSLEDLRKRSYEELYEQKSEQMHHYRNFLAAGELAKRVDGQISDSAYDAVSRQMMESLVEQARAEKTTVDDLLKAQGSSEDQYRLMTLMQARNQLRQGAALDAWARHRGIEVTPEDIDAFYRSSGAGENAANMREEIEAGGYAYLAREGALRLKASDDLVSCAIIHEDETMEMPSGV